MNKKKKFNMETLRKTRTSIKLFDLSIFFYHALYWLRRKSVSVIVSGKRTRVCDPALSPYNMRQGAKTRLPACMNFSLKQNKKLEGSQPHKEATLSVPIRRRNNSRLEPLNKAFRNWLKETEGRSGVLRGRKSHVWKVKYISSPELRGEKKKL